LPNKHLKGTQKERTHDPVAIKKKRPEGKEPDQF